MAALESEVIEPRLDEPITSALSRSHICADGKFLEVDGNRFWAKGVTYGTFSPNEDGEPFPRFDQVRDDFSRMRECGINTVRLYSPPSDRIADAAADAGLFLIPDISWGPRICLFQYPDVVRSLYADTRAQARRLAGHPAILMFSVGNEIPPLIVRWQGRTRTEEFVRNLYEISKEEAPETLVTYVNHPPTEYLHLPFLDVISYNVYLERESDFRAYLARLHSIAGNKPLMLAELGLDSLGAGTASQADSLAWQLRACVELGLMGAAVYSWTDEWAVFGHSVDGWAFGLTDASRRPKPALKTVTRLYQADRYEIRPRLWPRVSVVVCSYNGGKTIGETLESLSRLTYPDYEVIVIDDGSTDDTATIARGFDVRLISVANGGLSSARNLGIESATGEIVAFIDSDAYADQDWLYFLVMAMEEKGAVAAGGPNLSPPEDGFVAQCIDHAPGNPTHVLLEDGLAEHIPGCNMAFRRDAILGIGAFDPSHRAAGDDVDVCWKLLVREERIAFSPSAVVWHHRRPSIKAYLRQQKGYGYAEAHLQRRYPGRFNLFGDLVWSGKIYDGLHVSLREYGLPALFRPRVYQGRFCGEPFQSIYQPFLTWWFQVFTTAEWQVLSWLTILSGVLGLISGAAAGPVLAIVGALMYGITCASVTVPAWHASLTKKWRGVECLRGSLIVGLCHLLQPLWRAGGLLLGLWKTRGQSSDVPSSQRLYGNLQQRERWLERIVHHLRDCGWLCVPCDDWDDADLMVPGPSPYVAKITTAYEDTRGDHFIRYRVEARMKRFVPLLWASLLALVPLILFYPFLLPYALPLSFFGWRLATARRFVETAVSQVAVECGEPLRMTPVPVESQ